MRLAVAIAMIVEMQVHTMCSPEVVVAGKAMTRRQNFVVAEKLGTEKRRLVDCNAINGLIIFNVSRNTTNYFF